MELFMMLPMDELTEKEKKVATALQNAIFAMWVEALRPVFPRTAPIHEEIWEEIVETLDVTEEWLEENAKIKFLHKKTRRQHGKTNATN